MKKIFFGIFAAFLVLFFVNAVSVKSQTVTTQKVFVVTYYGGQSPSSNFDYNSLAQNIANDLTAANKGNLHFQIVKNQVWQRTATQLGVNCDQYLSQVQSGNWTTNNWQTTNCWGSGTADYNKMLSENNVCDLINAGTIDEVWFLGFGNAGFWEANMTGAGAFWTNGPIVTGTNCNKATHIMGFNYQLSPDFALHSFGHRIEGTMRNFLSSDFSQFTIYSPGGNSSCGNVHFPPNGNADYDYADLALTNSDCEDWNVNHTGVRKSINCNEWGCSQLGYMTWWLKNIPSNWWNYIAPQANLNLKIKLQRLNVASGKTFTVTISKNNSTVYTLNVSSDPNGIFTISEGHLATGTYDIYIKDNSHLQKKFSNITLENGTNNLDFTSSPLLAGDFDNNNKINLIDIGKMLSQYTQLEVPVTSQNAIYDVNGDGNINIVDVAILLSNYTALEIPGD